jgi:hypothetical protein
MVLTYPLQRHSIDESVREQHRFMRAQRRSLRYAPNVLDAAPLFIGTGTHYVNLFIGSPPQVCTN